MSVIDYALETRDRLEARTGSFTKPQIVAEMERDPNRVNREVVINVASLAHSEVVRAATIVCRERHRDGLPKFPAYTTDHRRASDVYSDADKAAMRHDLRKLQIQQEVLALHREGDVVMANALQRSLSGDNSVAAFLLKQTIAELEDLGASEDAEQVKRIANGQ